MLCVLVGFLGDRCATLLEKPLLGKIMSTVYLPYRKIRVPTVVTSR